MLKQPHPAHAAAAGSEDQVIEHGEVDGLAQLGKPAGRRQLARLGWLSPLG
ncbi:hypothetical protein SH584_03810 [Sphingomonas sp. LY29]|uniref:hypothetical protein n=1 Tax=Sphingomonas sp. LY29 TaxID=3095341 RepID=UPI002D7967EC|nr:hypothetical protein [Sphingomonas sp. LY29]WRP26569.1 hypothetical protein SH584_03810 [Sphingomonas sp. LY29]